MDLVYQLTKFSLPNKIESTINHKIIANFNEAKSNFAQLKIRSRLLIQQYHEGMHMALTLTLGLECSICSSMSSLGCTSHAFQFWKPNRILVIHLW